MTWLGFLLIPIGLTLFFVSPRWLGMVTIFSIPFTATSLFNTGTGVPITPLNFFGCLWIFSQWFVKSQANRRRASKDRSLLLFFIFMCVVISTMIMPWIIDGDLWVSSNDVNDLYNEPLRLTIHNIKNPLPVIFLVSLVFLWVLRNRDLETLRLSVKTYVTAGVFVTVWGYFQFCCSILGVQYPYFVFNNSVLDTLKGHEQVLDIDGRLIARITSVAYEPSVLAKYLITVIPILIFAIWSDHPIFSKKWDRIVIVMFFGLAVISTASTAYLGLVIISIASWLVMSRLKVRRLTRDLLVASSLVLVCAALAFTPWFNQIVSAVVFEKADSGSAFDRLLSVTNSWQYFVQYPVLGVGWGMVTSHDLIVSLLANSGIIGLTAFFTLVWYILHRSFESLKVSNQPETVNETQSLIAGLVVSMIALLVAGVMTGVEFYLGYLYFVASMLIAANRLTWQPQYELQPGFAPAPAVS